MYFVHVCTHVSDRTIPVHLFFLYHMICMLHIYMYLEPNICLYFRSGQPSKTRPLNSNQKIRLIRRGTGVKQKVSTPFWHPKVGASASDASAFETSRSWASYWSPNHVVSAVSLKYHGLKLHHQHRHHHQGEWNRRNRNGGGKLGKPRQVVQGDVCWEKNKAGATLDGSDIRRENHLGWW